LSEDDYLTVRVDVPTINVDYMIESKIREVLTFSLMSIMENLLEYQFFTNLLLYNKEIIKIIALLMKALSFS
jgi:hypothetical protein